MIFITTGLSFNSGGIFHIDFLFVASKKNRRPSLVNTTDQGVPGTGILSTGLGPFLSSGLGGEAFTGVAMDTGPVPNLAATNASSSFSSTSIDSCSIFTSSTTSGFGSDKVAEVGGKTVASRARLGAGRGVGRRGKGTLAGTFEGT